VLEKQAMSELAEIDGQAASTLVYDFMICARCGTVDREKSRREVDSDCRLARSRQDLHSSTTQ
jgi:hypothetical protein